MHILTALYGHPTDPAAFEAYYDSTHGPLVEAIPQLKGWTSRLVASLDGTEPPYYRIAELTFASAEDLQAGLASPEGQATANDIPNFASGGATLFVAHD